MSNEQFTMPRKLAHELLGALFNGPGFNPAGYEELKQDFAARMRATGANDLAVAQADYNDDAGALAAECEPQESITDLAMAKKHITQLRRALTIAKRRAKHVAVAAPDGWQLVPKEPTDAMQAAGAGSIRFATTALNRLWTGNAAYRAMLAAAPAAPVGGTK